MTKHQIIFVLHHKGLINNMQTLDWKPKEKKPKALLIGHDPRLQKSDTQAEFVLFANYYFDNTIIKDRSFKSKFSLAESAFNQITDITNGKIKSDEIYITNLCNSTLPHAPKNKTVYIPEEKAKEGFENIKRIILENESIEYIFPMSLQVNYWLQKFGLYDSKNSFLEKSSPKLNGILNNPPYFEPNEKGAFLMICGSKYQVTGDTKTLFPILHSKCFPLNKVFRAYEQAYERIRNYF